MSIAGALCGLALLASAPLEDPELEARAQSLMREIRCVACENEPVSESAAEIAEDMRDRIRMLIADGASDAEVRDWFEARYGTHALFRPPARGVSGWALWLGPFALLLAGAAFITTLRRRTRAADIEPVAAEDHTRDKEL